MARRITDYAKCTPEGRGGTREFLSPLLTGSAPARGGFGVGASPKKRRDKEDQEDKPDGFEEKLGTAKQALSLGKTGARLAEGFRGRGKAASGISGSDAAGLGVNAARGAVGAPLFTHEFTDPRFGDMRFPSTGEIAGVPTTSIGGLSPSDINLATTAEQGATGAASGFNIGDIAPYIQAAIAAINTAQTMGSDAPADYKAWKAIHDIGMGVGTSFFPPVAMFGPALSDAASQIFGWDEPSRAQREAMKDKYYAEQLGTFGLNLKEAGTPEELEAALGTIEPGSWQRYSPQAQAIINAYKERMTLAQGQPGPTSFASPLMAGQTRAPSRVGQNPEALSSLNEDIRQRDIYRGPLGQEAMRYIPNAGAGNMYHNLDVLAQSPGGTRLGALNARVGQKVADMTAARSTGLGELGYDQAEYENLINLSAALNTALGGSGALGMPSTGGFGAGYEVPLDLGTGSA